MEYIILWLIGIGIAAHAALNTPACSRTPARSPRAKTIIGLGYKVKVYK